MKKSIIVSGPSKDDSMSLPLNAAIKTWTKGIWKVNGSRWTGKEQNLKFTVLAESFKVQMKPEHTQKKSSRSINLLLAQEAGKETLNFPREGEKIPHLFCSFLHFLIYQSPSNLRAPTGGAIIPQDSGKSLVLFSFLCPTAIWHWTQLQETQSRVTKLSAFQPENHQGEPQQTRKHQRNQKKGRAQKNNPINIFINFWAHPWAAHA